MLKFYTNYRCGGHILQYRYLFDKRYTILEDYMRKNLKSSVTIPNSMSLYDMLRNTVLMILSPVINMNNYKSV